jgi:hypothetical protein
MNIQQMLLQMIFETREDTRAMIFRNPAFEQEIEFERTTKGNWKKLASYWLPVIVSSIILKRNMRKAHYHTKIKTGCLLPRFFECHRYFLDYLIFLKSF